MNEEQPPYGFPPPPPGYPPPGYAPPGYAPPGYQPPYGYPPPPPPPPGNWPPGPPGYQPMPGPPVYELASWWNRVGAYLIDGLIVTVITAPLMIFVLVVAFGEDLIFSTTAASDDLVPTIIFTSLTNLTGFAVGLMVGLLYPSLMMAKTDGRTVGKRVCNIRVVRETGEPMSYGYAVLREMVVKSFLMQIIPLLFLVDGFWPLWDDGNRALHDMVVKSRVVRDGPVSQPYPPAPMPAPMPAPGPFPGPR